MKIKDSGGFPMWEHPTGKCVYLLCPRDFALMKALAVAASSIAEQLDAGTIVRIGGIKGALFAAEPVGDDDES